MDRVKTFRMINKEEIILKNLTGKACLVLAVGMALVLMLFFGKWLGVESFFLNRQTTLLHFGKAISDLSSYVSNGFFTVLTILVYGGLIASLATLCLAVVAVLRPVEERKQSQVLCGFYVTGAFALFIILLVIISNIIIKQYSDGWISGIFGLTAMPFLAIILSIGGVIAYQKLPDSSFEFAKSTVKNKVDHVVDMISKETVVCPYCGAKCKEETTFCPQCGKKLPAIITRICLNCGKKIPAGAKFCPDCGTPLGELPKSTNEEEAKS